MDKINADIASVGSMRIKINELIDAVNDIKAILEQIEKLNETVNKIKPKKV